MLPACFTAALLALSACKSTPASTESCEAASKKFAASSKTADKATYMDLLGNTVAVCADECDRHTASSCALLDDYLDHMCTPGDTIFCATLCAEGQGSLKEHGCARK